MKCAQHYEQRQLAGDGGGGGGCGGSAGVGLCMQPPGVRGAGAKRVSRHGDCCLGSVQVSDTCIFKASCNTENNAYCCSAIYIAT